MCAGSGAFRAKRIELIQKKQADQAADVEGVGGGAGITSFHFSFMNTRQQRPKRPRTHQPGAGAAPAQEQLLGRDQLLLKSPKLQSRLGLRVLR
jgi:hypothetical protein